jgi:hypothetical protein
VSTQTTVAACDAPLGRGPPRWLSGAATTERARRRRTDSATGRRRTPTALGRRHTPRGGARSSGRGAGRSWRPSLLQTKERKVRICFYVCTDIYIYAQIDIYLYGVASPCGNQVQCAVKDSRGTRGFTRYSRARSTEKALRAPCGITVRTQMPDGNKRSDGVTCRLPTGTCTGRFWVLTGYSQGTLSAGYLRGTLGPSRAATRYSVLSLDRESGPAYRQFLKGYSRSTRGGTAGVLEEYNGGTVRSGNAHARLDRRERQRNSAPAR